MDLEKLWIGDRLRVIATGEIGTFEGTFERAAVIKIQNEIRYFLPDELMKASEEYNNLRSPNFDLPLATDPDFDPVIDLHLEKLKGFESSKLPYPLDYQLQKCKSFLQRAIALKVSHVTIIHGVGTGILKSAVEGLLQHFPEIVEVQSKHQGGALEVRFTY